MGVNAIERILGRPHIYLVDRQGKKDNSKLKVSLVQNFYDIPPIPRKHNLHPHDYYAPLEIELLYAKLQFAEDAFTSYWNLVELADKLSTPAHANTLVMMPVYRNPKGFLDCGIGVLHFKEDKRKKEVWFNPEKFRNQLRRLFNRIMAQHWRFHTEGFVPNVGGVDAQAEARKWEDYRLKLIKDKYIPACPWNTNRVD